MTFNVPSADDDDVAMTFQDSVCRKRSEAVRDDGPEKEAGISQASDRSAMRAQ